MSANPILNVHEREHTILDNIREGAMVYDRNNTLIGQVDSIYLGEASQQAIDMGDTPATVSTPRDASDDAVAFIQRVFAKDELPQELRKRLLQHGFIHINVPGLLAHDRYVLPEQITLVTTDGIILKASRDDLIKG